MTCMPKAGMMIVSMRHWLHRRILTDFKLLQTNKEYSQCFMKLLLGIKVGNKTVGSCRGLRNRSFYSMIILVGRGSREFEVGGEVSCRI